ncbi:MAG: hypothetical protein U0894_03800 [Pirellulales bacterium]
MNKVIDDEFERAAVLCTRSRFAADEAWRNGRIKPHWLYCGTARSSAIGTVKRNVEAWIVGLTQCEHWKREYGVTGGVVNSGNILCRAASWRAQKD